jgi:hypothetical protein
MKTERISNYSKNVLRWFLLISLLLAGIIIVGVLSASPAAAQCSTPKSSCVSCHGDGNHVAGMDEWNSVHVTQDICTYCHGGNGSSMDKSLAHEGLVAQPLSDIYTSCHSCHPSDYVAKASQFAETLNVTPASCATPTAIVAGTLPGGTFPKGILPLSNTTQAIPSVKDFLLLSMVIAMLAFFMFGLRWLDKHHSVGS